VGTRGKVGGAMEGGLKDYELDGVISC